MNETTKRTGLREAVVGVVLMAGGMHLFAIAPVLGITWIGVGAYLSYVGITTK